MARNAEESAAVAGESTSTPATEGATPTEGAAAAATEGGTRQRVVFQLDEEAVKALGEGTVGQEMARKDYVLKRWAQGVDRGPISKELTRLEKRKVPYQIVFQATKGKAQGPKAVAAPATPAPEGGEAAAA